MSLCFEVVFAFFKARWDLSCVSFDDSLFMVDLKCITFNNLTFKPKGIMLGVFLFLI